MAKRSSKKKQPAPPAASVGSTNMMEEATGTKEPYLQKRLMNLVYDTLWTPDGLSDDERMARVVSAISLLKDIKPSGAIESMLATQMVATHHAAMECFRRAIIKGQTVEGRDQNLKHAAKLLTIYSRQIEVLDKHRGKSQQNVTVQHVHVAAEDRRRLGTSKPERQRWTEKWKPDLRSRRSPKTLAR